MTDRDLSHHHQLILLLSYSLPLDVILAQLIVVWVPELNDGALDRSTADSVGRQDARMNLRRTEDLIIDACHSCDSLKEYSTPSNQAPPLPVKRKLN